MRKRYAGWARRYARRQREIQRTAPAGRSRPPRTPISEAVTALGEMRRAQGSVRSPTASPLSSSPAASGRSSA